MTETVEEQLEKALFQVHWYKEVELVECEREVAAEQDRIIALEEMLLRIRALCGKSINKAAEHQFPATSATVPALEILAVLNGGTWCTK